MKEFSTEEITLLKRSKCLVIAPDGVGSKGDEAMICGVLDLFQGEEVLILNPSTRCWKDELFLRTHLFSEIFVPLEDLPMALAGPKQLVVIGADTLDGSCGYESAHWRLQAVLQAIKNGGETFIFCSIRSDMSKELIDEWKNIPDEANVFLRDEISIKNYEGQISKKGKHFSDLAFFAQPIETIRAEHFRAKIEASSENKKVIGLEISETMFRSFNVEINDQKRQEFAYKISALAVQGLDKKKIVVVLFTHDTRSWSEHWSDYQYALAAYERLTMVDKIECVLIQPPEFAQAELLTVCPLCNVLICGRMHISITAYCSGVVPLLVAGQGKNYVMLDKVRGMCREWIGTDENLTTSLEKIPDIRDSILRKHRFEEALKAKLLSMKNGTLKEEKKVLSDLLGVQPIQWDKREVQEYGLMHAMKRAAELQRRVSIQDNELLQKSNMFEKMSFEKEKLQLEKEELQKENTIAKDKIDALELQLKEKMKLLDEQNLQAYNWEQRLKEVEAQINELNSRNIELMNRSNQLDTVYASRTWRYAHKLAKMARFFCPPGSLRARVIGGLVRAPLRFEHWLRALPTKLREKKERKHFFERLKLISLPECETPVVSIIIPVYNQFMYTYNCLSTIATQCRGMEYEVIIADDNSKDETAQIKEKAPGVIVVRNAENLRFLRNCNNAAKSARGKYVVFLNNDTEVQPDWLQSLLTTIEADEKIGMVGSKLVYSNGQLQEAGGILWRDGSAWNYGHGDDPEKSEYNYVKDVDYISGCSILIRLSLWQEIGGFDERFAPAYCEDSDLAFEVRAHGYRVVYQPASVVIHHEGISNGTDTSNGQKQYQVINSNKFREKWKDVLQKEQFPNAQNVFCARDRSGKKPCILFIDHYTPTFDQDAGSRTVYEYLRLFVKMGYNVKFIPDNFYRMPKYCEALQQLGIEVLYGPDYAQHWKDWVIEHRDALQFVFTNRPHISIKYMDFLRNNTNAKIMYYGHDLHSLRERREYELSGDPKLLESSEKWKSIEYSLMRKADIAYYPSEIEQQVILENDPTINVKVLVPYIFYDVQDPDYHISDRRDVMFLGGFNHGPNVDAALWFAKEIFPLVQKELPHLHWHILGSHPPKEVEELTCGKITVHGFVTDEQLAEFYASCRMSIVPLRYGAGIKGKVIEAMKFGIPVLTTSVGAEGIGGSEDALAVEDEPQAFADRLISLYTDEEALRKMSKAAYQYILTNYAPEKAMKLIEEDFT